MPIFSKNEFRYGTDEHQIGDLYLPARSHPPVICLLHGGFWRMPYHREECTPIAMDLAARGYAVWNIEYRRVGGAGGGWPGTFEDVVSAVDHVAVLAEQGLGLDLDRVIAVGHSAGGHLALWVSSRNRSPLLPSVQRVRPFAAAALGGVMDLERSYMLRLGERAVTDLLGAAPEQEPQTFKERIAAASPKAMLPLRVPHCIIHTVNDDAVPLSVAQDYVRAAATAGDMVTFRQIPDAGHMDHLDPARSAHAALCEWLSETL